MDTIPYCNCNKTCIYAPNSAQSVIKDLCKHIHLISDNVICDQVSTFCDCLSAGMIKFGIEQELPKFNIDIDDDETYLEWTFNFFKFGFLFCSDKIESGWFIIIVKDEDDTFRFNSHFNSKYYDVIEYVLKYIGCNA